MKNLILKGKLHRVVVTGNDLNYEGSVSIDKVLLKLAGIYEFEKVEIYNINTGERVETYAIADKADSTVFACVSASNLPKSPPNFLAINTASFPNRLNSLSISFASRISVSC